MAQTLEALSAWVEALFVSRHGVLPDVLVAAPGRVNLIGEHIDYNDGFVLPMAIARYVVIAASAKPPAFPVVSEVYSANLDETAAITPDGPDPKGWARYVEGVLAGYRGIGAQVPAFNAVIGSSVPAGSGLSSSAALEVAVATMIEALCGLTLDPVEKALICQRAEHEYAGTPCGIMDQFASVFGKAGALLRIDCRSREREHIPFGIGGAAVLISDSNVKHTLADGAYAQRRAQCDAALKKLGAASWRDVSTGHLDAEKHRLSAEEYRRGRHVVGEIARTVEASEAIARGAWEKAGALMYASHDSLRDDFEVSCTELDSLVAIARDLGLATGVYGARMTGGGFGGCTVTLVAPDRAAEIMETLLARYAAETGIRSTAFVSAPARGAHVIRG